MATDFDKTQVMETWNGLQALQKETEALLLSVKGKPKQKKKDKTISIQTTSIGKTLIQQTVSNDKPKKKKKIKMTDLGLDLDKTRDLYKDTRITVEVLDDASPDTTPRADYDIQEREERMNNIKKDQQKIKLMKQQEENYRTLKFDIEKDRVNSKLDTFYGAPGVSEDDVRKERERLSRLEESARLLKMKLEEEVSEKRVYLEKDKAAIKFQKVFRGHIGRMKYTLSRKLKDIIDDQNSDWIEVRDRQSGDVWYYNKVSGVSQWEKPNEMFNRMSKKSDIKLLPTIQAKDAFLDSTKSLSFMRTKSAQSDNRKGSSSPTQLPSLDATLQAKYSGNVPVVKERKPWEEEEVEMDDDDKLLNDAEFKKELEEAVNSKQLNEGGYLAPDGHFKPNLHTTVLDALLESRFDTVSTVMADDRWMEADSDPFLKEKKKRVQKDTNHMIKKNEKQDLSRKPMVAMVTFNKAKAKNNKEFEVTAPTDLSKFTMKDLTLNEIDHPGINNDENMDVNNSDAPMCFGCWSAGVNRKCGLHTDPDVKMKTSQTMLLCRNWDLDVMRRRYRAEEMQEIFLKKAASLQYDVKRKKFSTKIEKKHQIYRGVERMLEHMNFRMLLFVKIKRWLVSMTEDVRSGHGHGSVMKDMDKEKKKKMLEQAKLMQLKRTLFAHLSVKKYFDEVMHMLPSPPITGFAYEERIGANQYLFQHHDVATGQTVDLINIKPIPVPKFLYQPRVYHLGIPRTIPMPRTEYSNENSHNQHPATMFIEPNNPAGWLERLAKAYTRESVDAADQQVKSFTPMPGLELIRRTKQPPPCSIKLATLGRKPAPENKAIGGLAMELLIFQLITTYVPPQYGNFMVMDKAAITPGISPELTITFNSVLMPPVNQMFVSRPIEHPLNYRRAPTITVTGNVGPDDRHYYGTNRPEQTGEKESHGFRTTAWSRYSDIILETDPGTFIPSEEVVSLNAPGFNKSVTTHADLTYPFCEPSTRDNSTLDFFHLLLTGAMSASKAQVFTALTTQEPGLFQKECRTDLPLGHMLVNVYRSWAFTQRDTIQEYKTDDGVSYWYHRRTGQTFWERPLYEEEIPSALEGGTILDMVHHEEPLLVHAGAEGSVRRYDQGEFRKIMLTHYESKSDAEERRNNASKAIDIKRNREKYDTKDLSQVTSNERELAFSNVGGAPSPSKGGGGGGPIGQSSVAATHNTSLLGGMGAGGVGYSKAPMPGEERLQELAAKQHGNVVRGSALEDDSQSMIGGGSVTGGHVANGHQTAKPNAMEMLPGVNTNMMTNLTENLTNMLKGMMMGHSSPEEMIQLGMGMGMALLGTVGAVADATINPNGLMVGNGSATGGSGGGSQIKRSLVADGADDNPHFFPSLTEGELAEAQFQQSQNMSVISNVSVAKPVGMFTGMAEEPIGVPEATIHFSTNKVLDKTEMMAQKAESAKLLEQPLTAVEMARQIKIQQDPGPTPDEAPKRLTTTLPKNADDAVKEKFPVVMYPELSSMPEGGAPPGIKTHGPAGEGISYVNPAQGHSQLMVKGADVELRKTVMPLPVGFANAIYAKRAAKQEVDYLPQVPNLPMARTVGRVKPRSAAMDWLAVAFDPWSAGKRPLNAEFVSNLAQKAEKIFVGKSAAEALDSIDALRESAVKGAYVTTDDEEGQAKQRAEITKAQLLAADFKKVCSLARHGKYNEMEDLMNQSEWNVPIDYQDEQGNSMLHLCCQNGNRRIVKMVVRRGATINIQNLTGQTPLHFAFGYGYKEVGEYLIKLGADDTIKNKDGLTCYEGLSESELKML